MDLLASFAGMLKQPLEPTDSKNVLDALLGKSNQGRESLILGQNGLTTYRKGNWTFIPPHKGWKLNKQVNIETGRDKNMQLFDLSADRGQLKNVAKDHPELIEIFTADIEAIVNKK
jgi:arylsulfatase A-like enzyme